MIKLFAHQQQLLKCLACEGGAPAFPVVLVHCTDGVTRSVDPRRVFATWSPSNGRFNTRRLSSRLNSALRKSTP